VFGRVHPTGRFPTVSLLATNAMAIPLCWFSLERLLSALMIIQIAFQFIPQIIALFAIRKYRKEIKRPYGMWFYPVPAIVALLGWIYVASTPEQRQNIGTAAILLVLGLGAYLLRARAVKSWPFGRHGSRSSPIA
jgi:amino acid transporter